MKEYNKFKGNCFEFPVLDPEKGIYGRIFDERHLRLQTKNA